MIRLFFKVRKKERIPCQTVNVICLIFESTLQREVALQVIFTGNRFDVGPRSPVTTGNDSALHGLDETTG